MTARRKKTNADKRANAIKARLRRTVKFSAPWPTATLRRWKSEGLIFSVRWRGGDLYPAFQFGPCDLPWRGVKSILRSVPQDARGWPLLSWFEARNVLLDRRKPSHVLKTRSDRVLEAAQQFYSLED